MKVYDRKKYRDLKDCVFPGDLLYHLNQGGLYVKDNKSQMLGRLERKRPFLFLSQETGMFQIRICGYFPSLSAVGYLVLDDTFIMHKANF